MKLVWRLAMVATIVMVHIYYSIQIFQFSQIDQNHLSHLVSHHRRKRVPMQK